MKFCAGMALIMSGGLALAVSISSAMAADQEGKTETVVTVREKVLLGGNDLTAGIPGKGELTVSEIEAWLANPKNHVVLDPDLPLGLAVGQTQMKGLEENPLTRAKIELGRQLYFDPRLSADNTISCASCHHPDEGYGKRTPTGVGIGEQKGNRNSPISYNRILSDAQFWDGRAASLEEQAKGPIQNPIEMGNTHDSCVASLKKIPGYQLQFEKIFGKDWNIDDVARAIASFERVLVTGPSAYDYAEQLSVFEKLDPEDLEALEEENPAAFKKYQAAQADAKAKPMSESAKRGRELFFSTRVNCSACHVGANLADEKYHNLGIGMDKKDPDVGRFAVTKKDEDWGAFKTPTVRNVVHSAPYMHDGSLQTLEEVVEHYAKGGTPNKNLSNKITKIDLTKQEKADLVEFMKACTGDFPKVEMGRLPADK